MKKVIVVIIILAIAAIAVMRINQVKHKKVSETGQDIQARLGVPVETAGIEKGDIENALSIYGMLKGKNEVPIYPKIGGRILQIPAKNGARVRAGQLLAQLETKEIQDNVNQARAGVRAAREQFALVNKGARPQERTQVENLVEQARQGFEIAQSNLTRMQTLMSSGVISQQQYDVVKIQYDAAKTGYENAKQQLSIVQAGARDEEKKMVEEQLIRAEAAMSFAQEQIKNQSITAPISGVISSRIVDAGTLVGPAMQYPMMTIVDDSEFTLDADISEVDLDKVRIGQEVELTIDAVAGKTFKGTVKEINPAATMGTRTYTLKIQIAEKDPMMKSGMFGRGKVVVEKKTGVIVISKDALLRRGEGFQAVVVKNEKAEFRDVKLGIVNTETAEVTEGLSEGEKIVIIGASGLRDGDKVKEVDTGRQQVK